MLKHYLSKRNILFILLDILLLTSSFFFLNESLGRFLTLLSFILIYITVSFITKDRIFSSIFTIFLILPFNITYQLPKIFNIFSTTIKIYDELVNGVIVNYLVPTISVLDVWCAILFLSIIFTKGSLFFRKALRKYLLSLILLISFLLLQNILIKELVTVIGSLRILLFFLLLILLIEIIKSSNTKLLIKHYKTLTLLSFFNLSTQGFIGVQQFMKGMSLNLKFLGESQVVSGMRGSSFIVLNDELFLRAYGTFPHPNILAGYLLLIYLLSVFIFFRTKGILRYLNILNILLSILLMFVTFSRIGIFLILLNIFVIIIYKVFVSRKILLKKLFNREVRIFSIGVPFMYMYQRFFSTISGNDNSLNERIDLLKSGIKVFINSLFLGCGSGRLIKAMKDFVPRDSKGIMILQPVHNIFVLMLTELGVFGFLIILFLMIKIFFPVLKRKFTIYTLLILVNILIIGSFDHYLLTLPQGITILLFFLLLIVLESYVLKDYECNVEKKQ